MSTQNLISERAQCAVKHILSISPEISSSDLSTQVASRLQAEGDVCRDTAISESVKAVADEEARSINAYIDLDKSTAFCLFVHTESGLVALTLKQIVTLIQDQ